MTKNTYMRYHDKYEEEINKFEREVNIKDKQAKAEQLICEIRDILLKSEDIDEKIFFYTVIINSGLLEYDTSILNEFVEWIMDTGISAEEQLYLHRQINHTIFITLYVQNEENKIMMWKWYRNILNMWKKEIRFHPVYIPYDRRNHEFYIIIAEQLIGFQHGPTKTALDRCKTIINKMNKKVLLINTAECVSNSGFKCIFHPVEGNYMEEYLSKEDIEWKNTKIPMFSCERNSIYPDTVEVLMKTIYDLAPECVIDLDGDSILGNLCAEFIPVVGIGLCPSELANSFETYHVTASELKEKEHRILEEMKIDEESVIKCVFTSDLREQDTTYTNEELMIDELKFQIVIVGARLDDEMTREFIEMLEELDSDRYQIHICGLYTKYADINQEFYEKCCINHGMVKDMLSFMEHMDLYINPTRMGGGTSSVEAMDKGVPVVTVRRGDVYTNTGEDFGVENYEEMLKLIERYRTDKEFYQKMSERAKERAAYLQDTDGIFTELLNQVRTREIEKK